ncbi:DUF3991 and TOPRIM domain-containing protein [Acetobacter sp. LMG 32666]|uniref:DUF3991 and TOPRIM domain-containing protein n=1 Tax=Acetobacter sp. LMG 32666 TaxID=2959295 RepID=UPI0030C7CF40
MTYQRFELSDGDRQKIRNGVSCGLLLERNGYLLVKDKSTRKCLKYRKDQDIIIVNHGDRGWYGVYGIADQCKGDVFDLMRLLNPSMKFREVCVELGNLVGIEPEGAAYVAQKKEREDFRSPAERWAEKKPLYRNGKVWNYLTKERCLPDWIVRRAMTAGCIRDGYHAAWFAHTDANGAVCGAELRGPDTHICLGGSVKTLFRFKPGAGTQVKRLVVCEAAIDALSFAALDNERTPDTLYVSIAGAMGPETIAALKTHLADMAHIDGSLFVVATDDDDAGNHFADMLYDFAFDANVTFTRRLPPDRSKDFNQTLKNMAGMAA